MATSFGLNPAALDSCSVQGSRVSRRSGVLQNSVSGFARCSASNSGRSTLETCSQQLTTGSTSKYDRIVAFVEAHATPVVSVDVSSSCDSVYVTREFEQPPWHNSYDEEAEEGELCDEPHLVFAAADVPAQVAAMSAAAAVAAPTFLSHDSWSYGDAENPKPWLYAWDEEAEGSYGLSDCLSLSAQLKAERRAALHEARHAARMARKMRRSQLHPQLGDLEHMQAWVGPAQEQKQVQRNKAGVHTRQYLLNMLAADGASRQYRKPMQWHLTFDEDVHGPDAPETVLGSC